MAVVFWCSCPCSHFSLRLAFSNLGCNSSTGWPRWATFSITKWLEKFRANDLRPSCCPQNPSWRLLAASVSSKTWLTSSPCSKGPCCCQEACIRSKSCFPNDSRSNCSFWDLASECFLAECHWQASVCRHSGSFSFCWSVLAACLPELYSQAPGRPPR